MSKKPGGLAAFTQKRPIAPEPAPMTAAPSVVLPAGRRGRGQGDTVALTVRIAKADWTRLHSLAMSEGTSLQTLAVQGFSELLAKHGLPPMETS